MSLLRLTLALWLAGSVVPAAAAPVYDDRIEDYTVVAGDTISGITRRLLGDETFWEDNWKLNPQVRDPDLLRIGQTLRIIVSRKVIAEEARVIEAINRTEKMIAQPRWQPAAAGDTLGSGQGLRTREKSTAALRFNAESSLRLGEFSQVFLARKETTLRGIDRGSIAVEQGDVDLVFAPLAKPKTQIEIVAGPSTTTPVIAAGKPTELRTGATEDGGARVMVFAGKSDVSAGGAAVAVSSGMGTRVPESGPPAPPEKLLAAPKLDDPALRWNYSNGKLRWSEVRDAAAYVVQVCADPACTELHQRVRIAAQPTALQVAPLPIGTSYWQVTAISRSDLDGFASAVGQIDVLDARPDLHGPMLALQPLGGFITTEQGAVRLGPEATLLPVAHDEQAGVQRIELREPNGAWHPWDGAALTLAEIEQRSLRLRAIDQLDQPSPELRPVIEPAP